MLQCILEAGKSIIDKDNIKFTFDKSVNDIKYNKLIIRDGKNSNKKIVKI